MNCPHVMRMCKKCGGIKFLFKFVKNKKSKYGFNKQCKQCQSEYDKKYNKDNKEKRVEYQKKYYEDNKEKRVGYQKKYREERKEEISEKKKQYYKEHKEEILEKRKQYYEEHKKEMKKYYEDNKEEISEKKKQYFQTPRGQVVAFNSHNRRRDKLENQGGGINTDQWHEMMDFFEWRCAYSGTQLNKKNRSIDHITALDNGGLNEIWNCIPMYKPYNSSKSAKDMLEWYQQQDFYSEERLQKIYEWQEYAYNKWNVNI